MATSTSRRRQAYRFALAAAFVMGLAGTLMLGSTPPVGAQADLTLDTLDVAGVNKTVSGNVTDLRLATSLDYEHNVPNADQRVITLAAGPANGSLDTVDYVVQQDPAPSTTGTVQLSGSLLAETALTASDVDPELAATETTELKVRATIDVSRPDGDPVIHTLTDTVEVALTDDGQLTATLGGTGNVSVQTDA